MKLELIVTSDDVHLRTVGEVFIPPLGDTSIPVVTDVIARSGSPARFSLDPGKYSYHFHVEDGQGKFVVAVKGPNGEQFGKKDFDTKYGFAGRVLKFTVT